MLLVYPLSILSICLLDCINMSKAKHQSLLGYLITKILQDWTSRFEFHNALIIVTTFYNGDVFGGDVFGNAYLCMETWSLTITKKAITTTS